MEDRTCAVDGCARIRRAKGWCSKHYYRLREDLCGNRGCTRPLKAKGLCAFHHREFSSRSRSCPECSITFTGHERRKYCSLWCKAQANRSPLRRAVESGDSQGVLAAARAASEMSEGGCWNWQLAKNSAGYPVVGQGGRGGLVHRHVMQASLGRNLGREPVHHKCANPSCVNPAHLQPVTHGENVAEMLSRRYLVGRVTELEAALMAIYPDHPALALVTEAFNAAGAYTVTTVTETPTAS